MQKISNAMLILTHACPLACKYCLSGDTMITMADFSQKPIKDVKIGDEVIGVDEYNEYKKQRRIHKSKVLQTHVHTDNLIRITFDDGTYLDVTENHKILKYRGPDGGWTEAGQLRVGNKIFGIDNLSVEPVDIFNNEYIIGYITAVMLGDGSVKKYDYSGRYEDRQKIDIAYRTRLAVKDDEIIERMQTYFDILDIHYTKRPFRISTYQGDVYKDALFSSRESEYLYFTKLFKDIPNEHSLEYYKGFLAGIYDAEGHIDKDSKAIRMTNSDKNILNAIKIGLEKLGISYHVEFSGRPANKDVYNIRVLAGNRKDNLRFVISVCPVTKRKGINAFYDTCILRRKTITLIESLGEAEVYNIGTDTRTYIANNTVVHNCFVHQEPSRMTLETAMDSAKFLIANAEETGQVPGINFFGGEPMVMWDSIIVPLTNWIRKEYKKPFNLSITTNGVLLNDERIKFMKDNGFGLLLSIDGAKETQDYNRPYHNGAGSFDTLEPLLPKVVAAFPNVTFRSTAIPATCEHVFENIMFAKDSGFKNFFVIPNVFEEWSDAAKATLGAELNKYIDYYIDEYRAGREPIRFSAIEDAFRDIKRINYAINHNNYRTAPHCSACGKCGLGSNRYGSIHPNGNIYGCQEMTSNEGEESIFYIGNIYTGVEDDRRQALMNLFDSAVSKGANCDTCKYDRICNGGCVANNYLLTGDMNIVAPVFCWWQQIILDGAIRIMQTLGNERNEMFKKKWGGIK